jgi:hypothetical protein
VTGPSRLGLRISRPMLAALTGVGMVIAATACSSTASPHPSGPKPEVSGPLGSWTPPTPEALAPLAGYQTAVQVAAADHLRVWIEADLVKRWEEGPTWFRAAINQVATLANQPGVVGVKIADELGYNDGMNSNSKISQFLSSAAHALHAAAPHKLILVDMVVPQLGCLPAHQAAGSPAAACARREQAAYPQLALPEVDGYLRMHAIDVLDLSTYLQSDSTYKAWGTTADAAQTAAWQEVARLGWPSLVRLQSRHAFADPGSYRGTRAQAAADLHLYVAIPLAYGAHAVDIWTWKQEYEGKVYTLMNPGMRPNAVWDQLERLRQVGDVFFTHFSPNSVESGVQTDLAEIATVFTDVFLPAGTG